MGKFIFELLQAMHAARDVVELVALAEKLHEIVGDDTRVSCARVADRYTLTLHFADGQQATLDGAL